MIQEIRTRTKEKTNEIPELFQEQTKTNSPPTERGKLWTLKDVTPGTTKIDIGPQEE